jgi:hypothetical protein
MVYAENALRKFSSDFLSPVQVKRMKFPTKERLEMTAKKAAPKAKSAAKPAAKPRSRAKPKSEPESGYVAGVNPAPQEPRPVFV